MWFAKLSAFELFLKSYPRKLLQNILSSELSVSSLVVFTKFFYKNAIDE
jgi:hypothetical protein